MKRKFFSSKNFIIIIETGFIIVFILYIYGIFSLGDYASNPEANQPPNIASSSVFIYNFNVPGTLYEAGNPNESKSLYWWVNSGSLMKIENGVGKTNQGELGFWNRWKILYALNNPGDTDNGLHPQNIFRLFSRNVWEDFREEVYFKINKDNLSDSSNRNISNGFFLISRFKDGNNLYYSGLRVDGTAIIKKKMHGEYFTLAQTSVWNGEKYDREFNPSLMPKNKWLGMRSEMKNDLDGKVSIKLYLDINESGQWKLVLDTIDDGKKYGGKVIAGSGSVGLRSDFMDVEFKNFEVRTL